TLFRSIHIRLLEDVATKSIADENIIPVLHHLKSPTFFSKDKDFWERKLIHWSYCLVYLNIPEHEGRIAAFIRRFLGHRDFNTKAKRMGKVVRVHVNGVEFLTKGVRQPQMVVW